MNDYNHVVRIISSNGDPALLLPTVFVVIDRDSQRVHKDFGSPVKGHPCFAKFCFTLPGSHSKLYFTKLDPVFKCTTLAGASKYRLSIFIAGVNFDSRGLRNASLSA